MVEKEYAQALLELASEQKKINKVTSELEAFLKLFRDKEFKLFLESPSIQVDKKKELLEDTLKDFSEITINFINVLLDNRRINKIEGIFKEYNNLVLNSKSITNVRIHSQQKLTKAQIDMLKASIEAKLKSKNIKIENIVDSTLIGGIVVYADDILIDLSTKGFMHKLKESL